MARAQSELQIIMQSRVLCSYEMSMIKDLYQRS